MVMGSKQEVSNMSLIWCVANVSYYYYYYYYCFETVYFTESFLLFYKQVLNNDRYIEFF